MLKTTPITFKDNELAEPELWEKFELKKTVQYLLSDCFQEKGILWLFVIKDCLIKHIKNTKTPFLCQKLVDIIAQYWECDKIAVYKKGKVLQVLSGKWTKLPRPGFYGKNGYEKMKIAIECRNTKKNKMSTDSHF